MDNIFTKIGRGISKSLLGGVEGISGFAKPSTNFVTFSSFFFWNSAGQNQFPKYIKAYGENPLVYMVVSKISKTASDIDVMVKKPNNGEPIPKENSTLI